MKWLIVFASLICLALVLLGSSAISAASTLRVPQDYSTVQRAIDAAQDGDIVLVSPGFYRENLEIADKSIILASEFYTTGDPAIIDQTILDGSKGSKKAAITVSPSAGTGTRITGFTIQNGEDGIFVQTPITIDNNLIVGNSDGIDYQGGGSGGLLIDNVIENNSDDAVDLDGDVGVTIEGNQLLSNGDEGIEFRLHAYSGPVLEVIIRSNFIHANGEDGIQLIDYADLSDRTIHIERNRISQSAMVGVGLMDGGETIEDFRAAPIPERIHLYNNTFVGNPYAVTGGANLIALNNIFVGSTTLALKNLVEDSIASYNLFWDNLNDIQGSNVVLTTTVFADPILDANDIPQYSSPAIDAGTAFFTWNGELVLDIPFTDYYGIAPDMGWVETNYLPPTATPTPSPTVPTPTSTPFPPGYHLRFAVIGDYGDGSIDEERVANLVDGWNPDFVITTGDNNYEDGEAATIDEHIGQFYSPFIGSYQGDYGPGSPTNRFFPSLGNHDWHSMSCDSLGCKGAYFDYFTLPGNERYYDVDLGMVHLFALDSDPNEPDGLDADSVQAAWLQSALSASTSCYDVVFFHHPPYSSGYHGSSSVMRWSFEAWGADVVLSGHDHLYERLDASSFPYFVNGAGGKNLTNFTNLGNLPPEVVSVARYNQDYGAMLVTAAEDGITYQFINAVGTLIDESTVAKDCGPDDTPTATHTPLPASTNTPTLTPIPSHSFTPTPTTETPTPQPTSDTPTSTSTSPKANTATFTPSFTSTEQPTHTPTTASQNQPMHLYIPVLNRSFQDRDR